MIDLDEHAMRAVASPIAQVPEMAQIKQLAQRQRRRRILVRATAVLGLVAAVGVATFATLSLSDQSPEVKVVAPPVGGSQPTNSTDLTTSGLVDALVSSGAHVTSDGIVPANPLAATAQFLCVDNTRVIVYEYEDRASRAAVNISPDGSVITVGDIRAIPEYLGSPHFFANGRIIVLVLEDDAPLLRALTGILGPTISPGAPAYSGAAAPCTKSNP